jgi:hypothetical protein
MPSRKALTNDWLRGRHYVGPAEFAELCALAGGTETYLRKLVRASGVAMHPLVEGVRQESFAELERTLLAMRPEPPYRTLVLVAKEHARLSLRSARTNRADKQEMIAWMTIWLQTPDLFPQWLALRKRATAAQLTATQSKRP